MPATIPAYLSSAQLIF